MHGKLCGEGQFPWQSLFLQNSSPALPYVLASLLSSWGDGVRSAHHRAGAQPWPRVDHSIPWSCVHSQWTSSVWCNFEYWSLRKNPYRIGKAINVPVTSYKPEIIHKAEYFIKCLVFFNEKHQLVIL